jgi:hypothetical protein
MISETKEIKYINARLGFLGLLTVLAMDDDGSADCPLAVLIELNKPLTLPTRSWFDLCSDAIVRGRLANRELKVLLIRVIRWRGGNARKNL